ncbi:MAG: tRNA pseudouridine(55) synthase TruB [Bdellovibrionales bacterium]|nr:tRNA pseudouridine(55) synthase TruB [Bdellovibrionales bacterium]
MSLQRPPGLLLIDKPQGFTSHDVVAKARRILQMKAIGHCGTLDPMATGLLILLIGDATKLSDHLLTQQKTYETTVRLGVTTDTLDMDGEIQTEMPVGEVLERLSSVKLEEVVSSLSGELELEIPFYSAKKVGGKKLYEMARDGEEVVLPKKMMNFSGVEFLGAEENLVKVKLSCEKGGFIRAWGKELGERLKVGGALSQLRRTSSNPWSVETAIALEELETRIVNDESLDSLGACFVPMNECLPHLQFVCVDNQEQRLLSHGQIPHSLQARLIVERRKAVEQRQILGIQVFDKAKSKLLALLQATPDRGLKIRKVFK